MKSERFRTIGSLFTFGRYKDLSLSDVLDMNPGYVYWCMAHLTPMSSRLCSYIDDFAKALSGEDTDSEFAVYLHDDTWENYDKVEPLISAKFERWKNNEWE